MPQRLEALIRDGLHHDNLLELSGLCEERFDQNPCLYAVLSQVFNDLANEYNGQPIETGRYDALVEALQEPLLRAVSAQNSSADVLLRRLNDLLRAFRTLER